jgi:hypothetical protein|tara:strand:- start:324 stop:608 length:285 start_codon:yes stop_codon:yes gene_type:complete
MSSKPEFESLFPNDLLKDEIEAIYDKLQKIHNETGKNHPVFQNGNVEKGDKNYSVSLWFNEKNGKRFLTYKRELKKDQDQNNSNDSDNIKPFWE